MESSDKSKKVRLSSSNILTYRRDERGVIQWDCFQAPDSAKQTTGDFDEPDGDAASVFTTQQSVPTGQNDSCRRSVKSLNNFYPGTGNLYQFQDRTLLTGSVETNHPLLQGCGMTGDFPPCAATGSSASPLNDSEVKVCVNAERMSDATGCFPSHYSPLTPPATPKKSHRVLRQGEGQGTCQVQGFSCHKPQTPRDGSKFSFPDSVASAQKWSCPPSPRTINSPELAAEAAVSGQRKENVSLISPCPPGAGYTPKSPVVLFQFDSNVDETILKRIIKKFNDDVAKEADEIKPITLQDPPKIQTKEETSPMERQCN
ncbi:uncharacterized protein LOC135463090 [Liolophura sinensis]|uniref:uncharacterized protein LOC135463090 n=1 Tax=Liolophura sinensis TaxID=3198878 RepID=UPI003158D1A3